MAVERVGSGESAAASTALRLSVPNSIVVAVTVGQARFLRLSRWLTDKRERGCEVPHFIPSQGDIAGSFLTLPPRLVSMSASSNNDGAATWLYLLEAKSCICLPA